MEFWFLFSLVLFTAIEAISRGPEFQQKCLHAHNDYRTRHGSPKLIWSPKLASEAQIWADHLAAIDEMERDPMTSAGENVFYMYGGSPSEACERAVRNWYQEVKNYDFKSPHLDPNTSHFSQVVWRNTKQVGVGEAQSKSGNFFLVARYQPRGNMDGLFNDNIEGVVDVHLRLNMDQDNFNSSIKASNKLKVSPGAAQNTTGNSFSPQNTASSLLKASPKKQAAIIAAKKPQVSDKLLSAVPQPIKDSPSDKKPADAPLRPVKPKNPLLRAQFDNATQNGTNNNNTVPTQPVPTQPVPTQPDETQFMLHVQALPPSPTDGRPPNTQVDGNGVVLPPKQGKDFRVEIRFPGMIYENNMGFLYSKEFEEVKRNITPPIIQLYIDYKPFQEVQLIQIRNGSIIPMLGLIFSNHGKGHLDRLTNALRSRRLGPYAVSATYITAVDLPDGFLKLTRPPQLFPGGGICAQPCSNPSHCFKTGCQIDCCSFHPTTLAPAPLTTPAPQAPPQQPQPQQPVAPQPAAPQQAAPPTDSCPAACSPACSPQCSTGCCLNTISPPAPIPAMAPLQPVEVPLPPIAVPFPPVPAPLPPAPPMFPPAPVIPPAQPPPMAAMAPIPGTNCPSDCPFACYPDCSAQCCSSPSVASTQCPASCPNTCAPVCNNFCCSAKKSALHNSRLGVLPLNSKGTSTYYSMSYSRTPAYLKAGYLQANHLMHPYYGLGNNAGHSAFVNHHSYSLTRNGLPLGAHSRTLRHPASKQKLLLKGSRRSQARGHPRSPIMRLRPRLQPLDFIPYGSYRSRVLEPIDYHEFLRPEDFTAPAFKRDYARSKIQNLKNLKYYAKRNKRYQSMRRNDLPRRPESRRYDKIARRSEIPLVPFLTEDNLVPATNARIARNTDKEEEVI